MTDCDLCTANPAPPGGSLDVLIRDEAPHDVAAIAAVTVDAFRNAAHTSHTEQYIVDALRDCGQLAVSLVAEVDGEIVGHVAVSPVTISDGSLGWYGLGPISVAPAHHGRGVGSRLMTEALARLRGMGAGGCVLLGDPDFYSRFGFRSEPALMLPDVPPEYFQAIAFACSLPSGSVTYHRAFEARG